MADRYWVGVDSEWHDDNNWASSSGGAGGAGIPTSSDDVYIDGNGNALCWATSPFECNDFNLLAGATETCLFEQGGIIYGDFSIADGYFGPFSGGGYTVEFKGNWLKTGGTFAVGTGTGVDPTCLFSGTSKTYINNHSGTASYQNFSVTGSYTFSGTKLAVANISQNLDISGTATIASGNALYLDGANSLFNSLTGTLDGDGYIRIRMDAADTIPTGGTLDLDVELHLYGSATLAARTWGGDVDFDVKADSLTLTYGSGRHYFDGYHKLTADDASITTGFTFDLATNNAEYYCQGKWSIDSNSFKQPSQFTLNLGDGVHIFTDDFQLGLFGGATNMSLSPGDSTMVFHLVKNQLYQFRMSRVVGGLPGTYDKQVWNKVYILRTQGDAGPSARFTDGFGCFDFRIEMFNVANTNVRLRTWNLFPQHDFTFDRFTLIGIDDTKPFFGYPVVTGFGFHSRMTISDEANVHEATICKLKVTPTIDTYNSELWASDSGLTSGVEFYDREVTRISGHRNILNERCVINSTPAPELIIEKTIQEAIA